MTPQVKVWVLTFVSVPAMAVSCANEEHGDPGASCSAALRSEYPDYADIYFNIGEFEKPDGGYAVVVLPDGTGWGVGLHSDDSGEWRRCTTSDPDFFGTANVTDVLNGFYQFHFERDSEVSETYVPLSP